MSKCQQYRVEIAAKKFFPNQSLQKKIVTAAQHFTAKIFILEVARDLQRIKTIFCEFQGSLLC